MKLSRAVLEVVRGAGGAAVVASIGCSPGAPAPPSPVVMQPVRSAPVLMQPLPAMPRGADVPRELVPLPAEEPAEEAAPVPPEHASTHVQRVNHTTRTEDEPTEPAVVGVETLERTVSSWPIEAPGSIPPNCGRG